MPEIILKNVTKMYGKSAAVNQLNLNIPDQSFITLLGPSGCGKTTTLRMIAGLETPTSGEISIGGQVVFSSEQGIDVPPEKRNVGFLFQNYALWPHMTVLENITFGLENLKWPKDKIKERADVLMKMLKITEYGTRYPAELSGGQQQRVAIARTLATGPKTLFMDEPLSNLDAKLRQKARTELVKIHEMFKPTMVYVTHDQIEAMTVAHRIAVMNQGRIQQIDTPANIYHHPANTFVATFIGSPAMNILQAEILDGKIIVGDCALKLPQERLQELGGRSKVLFGLRPEACTPSFESAMINGKADFVENTGNLKTATLKLATGESFYLQDSDQGLQMEDIRGFNFDWQNVCLFDAESGENLAKVR